MALPPPAAAGKNHHPHVARPGIPHKNLHATCKTANLKNCTYDVQVLRNHAETTIKYGR